MQNDDTDKGGSCLGYDGKHLEKRGKKEMKDRVLTTVGYNGEDTKTKMDNTCTVVNKYTIRVRI